MQLRARFGRMCRFACTLAVLTAFTAGLLGSCSRQDRKGEQPPAAEAPPAETPPPASPAAQEPPADEPATPVEPEVEPPAAPEPPRAEPKPTEPPEPRAEPKAPPKRPRDEPRDEPRDIPGEPDQPEPAQKQGSLPVQGQPCDSGRCAVGLSCVEYYGIAGPRGPSMSSCEIRCPAGKGCPAGQHCTTISDGPGPVCRPH